MKYLTPLLIGLILTLSFSCSIVRHQGKGIVSPKSFNYSTDFTTVKTVIILPVSMDGVSKNFIFDTGADLTIIQRDSMLGKTLSVSGATKRKMRMGQEYIPSIKIGTVDFQNTFALNADLIGLKEQISDFGGLIGQSIINKANWLIDYPNKKLQISNEDLVGDSFTTILIEREDGAPYTYITINDEAHKVIIDFGSSSEFNLPKESKLAKALIKQYDFKDNERERYTIGGLQTITEKVGTVPLIKLGNLDFENVNTKINISSQPRIGIGFFKDCKIYIDNISNCYKVKK